MFLRNTLTLSHIYYGAYSKHIGAAAGILTLVQNNGQPLIGEKIISLVKSGTLSMESGAFCLYLLELVFIYMLIFILHGIRRIAVLDDNIYYSRNTARAFVYIILPVRLISLLMQVWGGLNSGLGFVPFGAALFVSSVLYYMLIFKCRCSKEDEDDLWGEYVGRDRAIVMPNPLSEKPMSEYRREESYLAYRQHADGGEPWLTLAVSPGASEAKILAAYAAILAECERAGDSGRRQLALLALQELKRRGCVRL